MGNFLRIVIPFVLTHVPKKMCASRCVGGDLLYDFFSRAIGQKETRPLGPACVWTFSIEVKLVPHYLLQLTTSV